MGLSKEKWTGMNKKAGPFLDRKEPACVSRQKNCSAVFLLVSKLHACTVGIDDDGFVALDFLCKYLL